MTPIVKMILLCLGMCVLSICMTNLIQIYVLVDTGKWTMYFFRKYLIINFSGIDNVLLLFFPLITGIYFLLKRITEPKVFFKVILFTFLTISLSLFSGMIIAIGTAPKSDTNLLLPDSIVYQPFAYYWTACILSGIFIPMIIHHFRNQVQHQNNEIIDV